MSFSLSSFGNLASGGLLDLGKSLGGGGSPPPAPDLIGAANAQGQANVDAARAGAKLSNPNIINPFGSQTVTYDGDVPTVTQTYDPKVQALISQLLGTQGQLGGLASQGVGQVQKSFGSPLDTSNIAKAPIDAGTTAQQAIMSRLQPQIERNRSQMQSQLANQGIPLGSEAYDNAMKDQGQQENDLTTQAALQGINLDTQAHQQGLQEAAYLRELPLNEVNSLMNSSQVQTPQFQGYQGQQVGAAPIFAANQALGQYGTDVYNAQQASKSNMMNGLFSLGGTLGGMAMLSDRRLKTDIVEIGKMESGLPIYVFRYKWEKKYTIGVMADEAEKLFPHAVFIRDGFKAVNYSMIH